MGTTLEASFEIIAWEETDLVEEDVRVYRAEVPKRFSGDLADIAGTADIERHDHGSHTLTLTVEGISP